MAWTATADTFDWALQAAGRLDDYRGREGTHALEDRAKRVPRLPYAAPMSTDFDAIVVGAGAVGLACGYALARDGKNVAVVERERRVGAGVSSRNSEVIHAGLHYAPGSLKARLCVQGRRLLYAFLDRHRVAFNTVSYTHLDVYKRQVQHFPHQQQVVDVVVHDQHQCPAWMAVDSHAP